MRKISLIVLIGLSVAGCAASNTAVSKQKTHVWISQTAGIELEEAYGNKERLFLKYRAFTKDSDNSMVFFTKAMWAAETVQRSDLTDSLVIPLEYIDEEQYAAEKKNLKPVKALSEHYWTDYRRKLAHEITPKETSTGIIVQSNKDELVFYYDEDEELHVVNKKDKPSGIKIKETISSEKLKEIILGGLKDYMGDQNISADRFILTAHNDDYTEPFIYVDFTEDLAVILEIRKDIGEQYKESFIKRGLRSADVLLVEGHILGVMKRPFSSAFQFLSWSKDTAYDIVNPSKINRIEAGPIPPLNQGDGMDLTAWEGELERLTKTPSINGQVDFLIDGDEFFPRLISAFRSAQETIDVRIFIFDNDDYAVRIADILKEKSKNPNIKVRVLLDGMGVVMGEGKTPNDLPRGFVPPASIIQYLKEDSNIEVRVRPNAWFKADHIKTIIVDGKVCFTGGMNIGREYRYRWHDMMMELQGPVVKETVKEFNKGWAHAGNLGDLGFLRQVLSNKHLPTKGDGVPLRLLYTRLNDPQIFKAQIAAIKNARKYIYINNAYFSDNAILYALINARRRGVDVRVILPVNGNHEIMNKSNIVTANILFKNGIRVFFYPGMSHIKAAVYDGWLCSGSANFDKLSFRDNLELNIATSDPKTVETLLKELFEPDFKRSKEMTEPLKTTLKAYIAEFIAEQL